MTSAEEAKQLIENDSLDKLLLKDQLISLMTQHKAFRGFQEVRCTPTF
jgi:hypothetical protein